MDKYLFSEDIHCGVTQILIVAGGGERANLELVARMNGDTAYKCRVWMAAPIQFVMDLLKYWSGGPGSLGTSRAGARRTLVGSPFEHFTRTQDRSYSRGRL